ncbi:MAG: hypothetical protein ACP5HG_16280 [Anaerolineae bacterium]
MPIISVPAVYDGERVRLLERPPDRRRYRVLVTFLEPEQVPEPAAADPERLMASFGAWEDDRSAEEIIEDLRETRQSRSEPPSL